MKWADMPSRIQRSEFRLFEYHLAIDLNQDVSSYAPTDMFALLSWACGIYTVCVEQNEDFSSSPPFKGLVGSIAVLLDMVLESSKSKDALKNGALARTRRALRSVSVIDVVLISLLCWETTLIGH